MKLTPIKKVNIGKEHSISISNEQSKVSEVFISPGGWFDSRLRVGFDVEDSFKLPEAGRKSRLDEGYRLWKYDAIGGTIVRTTTFFVLGKGVVFQFDDPKAQEYAKKFYKKNNLEMKLRAACDESVAFGEIFFWLRPHLDEVRYPNGKVIWRQGDVQVSFPRPNNITGVETAEEDITDVYNYVYEYTDSESKTVSLVIPDISKYNFDSPDPNGCIVHLKLNAGNMDPFGHSDLMSIKEWLDNYQEYLRDSVIINKLYRSPAYDISIEDATEDEIDAAVARYAGWRIGSNPVHSSKETWDILEFTGPNTSNSESRRSLLLMIAAGVGFAEYMLADGANSNLASTKSQQLPVIKKFEDRQDILSHLIMKIFQFVLTIKSLYGRDKGLSVIFDDEGDMVPFEGTIEFPAIAQDADKEIAETNEIALTGGYMSIRTAASRLGLDLDRELEMMEADADIQAKLNDLFIKLGLKMDPEKAKENENNSEGKPTATNTEKK